MTEQQHTGGTGEGGVNHSLEVEVLPGGEEGEEVERRRPGEGCDGGEREELERLEDVGDLRHAVGRVDAAAQVHPSLRVRPHSHPPATTIFGLMWMPSGLNSPAGCGYPHSISRIRTETVRAGAHIISIISQHVNDFLTFNVKWNAGTHAMHAAPPCFPPDPLM
jgi:hypothetical protein